MTASDPRAFLGPRLPYFGCFTRVDSPGGAMRRQAVSREEPHGHRRSLGVGIAALRMLDRRRLSAAMRGERDRSTRRSRYRIVRTDNGKDVGDV